MRVLELERAEATLRDRNDQLADMRIQLANAKSEILELHEKIDKMAGVSLGRSGQLTSPGGSVRSPSHARSPGPR